MAIRLLWIGFPAAAAVSGAMLRAQESPRPPIPQIVASAQGEVRVVPDRAVVTIGVLTRASTAAEAAAENSKRQRAVIEAIRARGVSREQISTSNFNVVPETRYDREGQTPPRITGYAVTNNITVELRRVDQVGVVLDTALVAGANEITGLNFSVSAADSARRAALSIAVIKARGDAEAAARAAGGSLGSLIELIAMEGTMPPRPVLYAARAMVAGATVPIEPGQDVVRATVTARWQFVSGAPR